MLVAVAWMLLVLSGATWTYRSTNRVSSGAVVLALVASTASVLAAVWPVRCSSDLGAVRRWAYRILRVAWAALGVALLLPALWYSAGTIGL